MKGFGKLFYMQQIFVLLCLLSASFSAYASSTTVVYGFDGTGKNKKFGDKTNVYRFLEAYAPFGDSYYINGVGSNLPGGKANIVNLTGVVTGLGAKKILNKMYDQLATNFKNGQTGIVIVGFSRGAALSRQFAHVIQRRGNPKLYRKGEKPKGKAPSIKFMALFDTVYSFGLAAGKKDLGFRKWIPSNVKAVAHATAKLEKRNTFDLWSIHHEKGLLNGKTGKIEKGNYRAEKEFNGGHDDIGGAEENNYYGYEPLKWVIEQGNKAGVRLKMPDKNDFKKVSGQEPNGKGIGKRQIYFPKIPAKTYKKAKRGCEGKQVYLSGMKCYACPAGYKRTSLTRKMTHPEACKERGVGFDKDKKPAKYVWGANGCPKHQFKHKGFCKKCPKGTKRIHAAGIDTGYCKVKL